MATKVMKRYRDGRRWLNGCLWSYNSSIPSCPTFPSSLSVHIHNQKSFATISTGTSQTNIPAGTVGPSNDWLLQRTTDFLDPNTALDTTDPQLWSDATHILQVWLMDPDPSTALDRVDYCLRLLDRLASIMPRAEVYDLDYVFETKLLHDLLTTWHQGMEQRDPKSQSSSSSSSSAPPSSRNRRPLTPSLMAGKIDKYRWTSLIHPDAKSYNLLLQTSTLYYKGSEGIHFADSLLQRLVEVAKTSNLALMDVVSLATVMHGWVRAGRPEKADQWMQQLHSWQETEGDSYLGELVPNQVLYSTVLSGWAKVGNTQRVMQILEWQLQSFQSGNVEAKADTITFNCVLDALAKSDDSSAPEEAERLIETMEHYAATLEWPCAPDRHTWSILLSCYSKHQPKNVEGRFASLQQVGRPLSLVAYNTMLNAYAKMRNIDAAVGLLKEMESSTAISPDVISYNSVLSGYSRSKDEDAPYHAEELFRHMKQQGIAPTDYSYGSLMQCWSKARDPDAPYRVEQILREMRDDPNVEVNGICFTAVLKAWLNKARYFRDRTALDRAMRLFEQMVTSNSKSLKPTAATFRTMMYGIVGSPVGSKKELLESLVPAMKRCGFRPNRDDGNLFRRFQASLDF